MKKLTVKKIMSMYPCYKYTEELVTKLIGDGKTLSEILELPIPRTDRFWVVLHSNVIPVKYRKQIKKDFSDKYIDRLHLPDHYTLYELAFFMDDNYKNSANADRFTLNYLKRIAKEIEEKQKG